jgi:hypothetical protein
MLRKPYTMDKLLGMVDGILLQTASFRAEMVPVSTWQTQPSLNRL